MRTRKFFFAIASLLTAAFVGACLPEAVPDPQISTDKAKYEVAAEGGDVTVKVTSNVAWKASVAPASSRDNVDDVTVTPATGTGDAEVKVHFEKNEGNNRAALVKFEGLGVSTSVNISQEGTAGDLIEEITIAEFLEKEVDASIYYIIHGTVTKIAQSNKYSNFYLNDGTAEVYIYGLYDGKGGEQFIDGWLDRMGIQVGYTMKIGATRGQYNTTIEGMYAYPIEWAAPTNPMLSVDAAEKTVKATATSAKFNLTALNVNAWKVEAKEAYDWITDYTKEGATSGEIVISFTENENLEAGREAEFTVSAEGAESVNIKLIQSAATLDLETITIAEWLAKEEDDTKEYRLEGVVTEVVKADYGNIYIKDATGTAYIYGVLTPDGESKKFETLGVEVGDILCVEGIRTSYNGNPQSKNATYKWHKDVTATTAAAANELADDDKNDPKNYIMLTGKVTRPTADGRKFDIETYGNFDLVDETGDVYIYGVTTGWNGERKQFASLGVKEGDVITIIGYKTSYNGTNEVVGFYVSHESGEPVPGEPVDLSVSEWRIYDPELEGAFFEFKFTSATEVLYGSGDAEDGFWEDDAIAGTYTCVGADLSMSFDFGEEEPTVLVATIDGNNMTFTDGPYAGLIAVKFEGETVSIANTPETAYTATEAIAIYDAGQDLDTPVYVKGVVTKILTSDANFEKYHNLDIMVADEAGAEFEFYHMKDIDNADFTENYIKVGDALVAYGTLTKYNTTYEIKNCYLVSRVPAAPSENVELEGTYWSNGLTGEDLMALEFANSKVIPTLYGSPYDAMDYTVEGNVVVFGGYYMGTVDGDTMAVTYMGQDLCTLTKGEKPAQTKTYTSFAAAQAAILAGETEFILDLAELAEFTYKNADGKSTYAQDATGGMLFYNTGIESWAYAGLRFKGGALKCTAAMFRGNPQITAVESWAGITKDYSAKYPCHTITLSELLTNFDKYINCKVKINGVTVTDGWGGSDRNGEIKLGDDVLAVYQKVSGNEQGAETGCEGNIVAWPTINNSDKQLAFWPHAEYPTKKFFEVTKEAPVTYPETLAETSWKKEDGVGGYLLVSFVDAENAFLVNGDAEGPWWEEIMEGKYTYDPATGSGSIEGAYSLQILENGNLSVDLIMAQYEFSPVDFVAKPAATPTYTTLADVQAAILANAGTGEYKFIMDLADFAEITYKNGSSVFAQDATGGVLFYGTGAEGWVYGGLRFKGGALECTAKIFNGVPEITAVASWADVVKDYSAKYPCCNVTLSELLANYDRYLNCKVKVSGVTVKDGWGGSDRNGVIAVGSDELNVYQQVKDNEQGAETGCEGNIIAWPTYYKTTKQLGFWPHGEYPAKKFFEVTKEAPTPSASFSAEWALNATNMASYKDLFGGTDGVVSKDEGFGTLADGSKFRVPATNDAPAAIYYYQIDKNDTTPTSGNPKRVIGGTGDPYITGGWPGDYWLIASTSDVEYEAGTKFNVSFLTRVSGTGHKYMMAEYWDGEAWKPAFDVQTETETGTSAQYNFVQGSANSEVNATWTLAKATKDVQFRLMIVANWQQNGKGALANPNGGTCRISERCAMSIVE